VTIRIAMWSGPRNISTAMMRSFGNRDDTSVIDEPFYAAYLAGTGRNHPMRAESMASQPTDWRSVVATVLGPAPSDRPIFYQKHMTHHMLPDFGRDWIGKCRNAFLIRAPEAVLSSWTKKHDEVSLADIGAVQQRELFEREADRLGHAPPVIAADDVLADPRRALSALCAALDIAFSEKMLQWPAGPRDTDGVWAAVWYDAVIRSTGFSPPKQKEEIVLPDALQRIADDARPHYEALAKWKIGVGN
jgi:Sulfotransferase domain